MGKRDVASFVVIVMFGASLAATSKPRDRDDEDGEDGSRRRPRLADAGDAGATGDAVKTTTLAVDAAAPKAELAVNADLPDTTAWKPFTHPATRLSGKTPPGADVTCAKVSDLSVCSVVRHAKTVAQFTSVGIGADVMVDMMKRDTSVPSTTIYEDDTNLAVMRSDRQQGSWCEMVASSPAGLKAVVTSPVGDAGIQAVTLNRTECLEMIAFGRTLVRTP